MRTLASTSQPARGERPNEPAPAPPTISAAGPSTEGHDSGSSQSSNGTNSGGAEGANQAPAPASVETVAESPVPDRATVLLVRGMPQVPRAQPLGALDPFRFTGALHRPGSRANPTPTPATPDSSVRQAAPETPMASSTRYGTEINHSMRHLY